MFGFGKKKDEIGTMQTEFEKDTKIIKEIFGKSIFTNTPDPSIRKLAIDDFKESEVLIHQRGLRRLGLDDMSVENLDLVDAAHEKLI